MRLTNKSIEQAVSEIAGERVLPLLRILRRKKMVSEMALAKETDCEVNEVRSQLYRLHHAHLVSFVKKKDKKKGWYVYFWGVNEKRVRELVEQSKARRLHVLEKLLEVEQNEHFFCCGNGCVRLDFEKTINLRFQCPECGSVLDQDPQGARIAVIKNEIARIHAELKD